MNTEQNNLQSGLLCAAWGYFFLYFDFSVSTINLLPRFAGYLLLLSAIDRLSEERRELGLLRFLCILLAGWSGADWLAGCFGADLYGYFPPLDLIITAVGLYFHFQFLTDAAALAEKYQPPGAGLDRRLLNCRTICVVSNTVIALCQSFLDGFIGGWQAWALAACSFIGMAAALTAMFGLFSLRKSLVSTE